MYAGKIIKLFRTVDGISQSVLAKKLKVTSAYLSQVENGRKQPSFSFLKRCSSQFRIPLPLLFFGEQEDDGNNEVFSQLQTILARLLTVRVSQLQTQKQMELWSYSDKEKS